MQALKRVAGNALSSATFWCSRKNLERERSVRTPLFAGVGHARARSAFASFSNPLPPLPRRLRSIRRRRNAGMSCSVFELLRVPTVLPPAQRPGLGLRDRDRRRWKAVPGPSVLSHSRSVEALAVYQASQVRPLGNKRCIQFEVLSATSRRLEVSMRAAGPPAGPRVLSDLVRSWRTLLLAMAAVLFLTGPSCTATDPETTESLPDPSATTPTTQTPTARAGQGAKAYLPDTSTWSFAVDDEDLIPWVDPIGHGIELIQDALSDKKARAHSLTSPASSIA